MTTLTTSQLRRKIEAIKEGNRSPDRKHVIVTMWCPSSSPGATEGAGFYSFDMATPNIKTRVPDPPEAKFRS